MNIKEKFLNFKAYPHYLKRLIVLTCERIVDLKDLFLIQRCLRLKNLRVIYNQSRTELEPYYQEYIAQVSEGKQAISLELAALLLALCTILKPEKILDLGSGFSSFMFRLYAKRAALKPVIWSVDDAREWLDKTEVFLIKHEVNRENLIEWSSFMAQNQDKFDFVLNDFSIMENRQAHFQEIISKVSPAGMLFLDDMHKPEYNRYVRRTLKKYNGKHYSLRLFRKDWFGRYSTLFIHCSKLLAT